MRSRLVRLFPIFFLLTASCASVISQHIEMTKKPGFCEVTEARPSWRSNIVYVVCWNDAGEVMQVTGVKGMSAADIIATLAKVGVAVGVGALIGSAVKDIELETQIPIIDFGS